MRTEPPFFQRMVERPKKVESNVRNRFGRGEQKRIERRVTLGELAASVAYYYKLSPKQVAEFSGPQLMLWYEQACYERGGEKLLDLQISISPHTEEPDKSVRELKKMLSQMIGVRDARPNT